MRYAFLFLVLTVISCSNSKQDTTTIDKGTEQPAVVVPVFNADSTYSYLKMQVDFGPRVPGTEAHKNCAEYLFEKLRTYCDTVIIQSAPIKTFDGNTFILKNIIASFNPQAANRMLLSAHWDTRPWADGDSTDKYKPFDGADDGASGVAVLIEVARQLKENKVQQGVDIVLFDLEDYGQEQNDERFPQQQNTWCLGSQYWAKNLHVKNYAAQYGILLDMVGGSNAIFPMEGTSLQYAPNQTKMIWDVANQLGYSSYFSYAQTNPTIDDHLYVNTLANIPCVDIVHYKVELSRYASHHHTHADNISVIDKNTLKVTGSVLMHLLYAQPL